MKLQKRERFDTPRSLYTSFRELLRELLASDSSFKAGYLATEVESKLLDPEYSDTPDVRRTRAIDKWLACEELNRQTNIRLMHHSEEDILFLDHSNTFPVSVAEVLSVARRFVAKVLGDSIPWESLTGSFSGGASTSVRRGTGTIARKFQLGTDITEGAVWHFLRLSKSAVWAPRDFTITPGNVLFTVPKSSSIDRCAAKEPDYNMFLQKAIGDYIRRQLRRNGINLNDQTLNQRLAKQGSIDRSLATIDLSSASDSVTTQLVLLLVPDVWFDFMDDVRSKSTNIDGEWHRNEMFSSMGNAFTFELESLIFWALTRACAYLTRSVGRISVYGDDIICPSGLETAILNTLEYCGFRVNTKKTFFEGPFRESCGKHWHNGYEVTPFYVKKVPVNVSDWIHLLNSFRRWCDSFGICDPRYFDLWSLFSETIPPAVRGGGDMSLRSILASPGRSPIAKIVLKQHRDSKMERHYAFGAYLHWLSASEVQHRGNELETSIFVYDGALVLRRSTERCKTELPLFPQELGL